MHVLRCAGARRAETGGEAVSSLHARICQALGWEEREAQSFSLLALRELLQDHPKLKAEVTRAIRSGAYIVGVK